MWNSLPHWETSSGLKKLCKLKTLDSSYGTRTGLITSVLSGGKRIHCLLQVIIIIIINCQIKLNAWQGVTRNSNWLLHTKANQCIITMPSTHCEFRTFRWPSWIYKQSDLELILTSIYFLITAMNIVKLMVWTVPIDTEIKFIKECQKFKTDSTINKISL